MRYIELKLAGLGAYGIGLGPSQQAHVVVNDDGTGQFITSAGFNHPAELIKKIDLTGLAWTWLDYKQESNLCLSPRPLTEGETIEGENITITGQFHSPIGEVVDYSVFLSYNPLTSTVTFVATCKQDVVARPITLVGLRFSAGVEDPEV